jgi:phytoene dehydrogenase-like protein
MQAASRALPGLQAASDLVLPGTPVTFARFTHRAWGWVGGFPQVNLFQSWGPRLAEGLWLVGDSIFPGQSTAAAALGGLRVAGEVRQALSGPKAFYALGGERPPWRGEAAAGQRAPAARK